ncbi:unnamed protein product, partial [Oppiella nova]
YVNGSNTLINCTAKLNPYNEYFYSLNISKDGQVFYRYDNRTKSLPIFKQIPGINKIVSLSPGIFIINNINKTTAGHYVCAVYYNNNRSFSSRDFNIRIHVNTVTFVSQSSDPGKYDQHVHKMYLHRHEARPMKRRSTPENVTLAITPHKIKKGMDVTIQSPNKYTSGGYTCSVTFKNHTQSTVHYSISANATLHDRGIPKHRENKMPITITENLTIKTSKNGNKYKTTVFSGGTTQQSVTTLGMTSNLRPNTDNIDNPTSNKQTLPVHVRIGFRPNRLPKGKDVYLACSYDNPDKPFELSEINIYKGEHLFWRQVNQTFFEFHKIKGINKIANKYESRQQLIELKIRNVQKDTFGEYRCKVTYHQVNSHLEFSVLAHSHLDLANTSSYLY